MSITQRSRWLIDTVHAVMGAKFLTRSLFSRPRSGWQLIAVLLTEQRFISEGVIEYTRKPVANRTEIGIAKWFASVFFGVLIALGRSFRAGGVIAVIAVTASARRW